MRIAVCRPQVPFVRGGAEVVADELVEELRARGHEAETIAAGTDYLDATASAVADLGEVLRLAGQPTESAAKSHEAIRLYEAKGTVAAVDKLRARIGEARIDD